MHQRLDKNKEFDYDNLTQGDKIKFKWYGNADWVYTGRIELGPYLDKFFVSEHWYENDKLTVVGESMRYYNRLMDFWKFTEFDLLEKHQGENPERSVATDAQSECQPPVTKE